MSEFCEPWIESKLRERLAPYKKRYPLFDVERVVADVQTWDAKRQRWAPYMEDKDIKSLNKRHHKSVSLSRLASLDNW